MRWAWSLTGADHAHRHLHEKVPRITGSSCRHGGRPGRETLLPAAHTSHVADDPGTRIGSLWNHRQAQDVGAGEGHDAADPGPCTISGLGEVSDETYPHQTTEGPERTPVARGTRAGPARLGHRPGQGTRADRAFHTGAWEMIARVGRRARFAVQTVIRAPRPANNERVYMWECVLLTRKAAPVTATGPLRWVSSPDPGLSAVGGD